MSETTPQRKKGPKKRYVGMGVLVASALYILCEYTIPRFPLGPFKLYGDLTAEARSNTIPYSVLTNETSKPFVSVIDRRDYRNAIERFPNVKSCLVQSERNKIRPDLRFIDWDKIRNLEDADVCTWRIFSSLSDQKSAMRFLEFHDAKIQRTSSSTFVGVWDLRFEKAPFPTRGWPIFRKPLLQSGIAVSSEWDSLGKLKKLNWNWQSSF